MAPSCRAPPSSGEEGGAAGGWARQTRTWCRRATVEVRMDVVFGFLAERPVIVLFLFIGVGAAFGRIRIGVVSLGAIAVLFTAIGLTAWSVAVGEPIGIPALVGDVGLVVFAFCTGIIAGPGFFNAIEDGVSAHDRRHRGHARRGDRDPDPGTRGRPGSAHDRRHLRGGHHQHARAGGHRRQPRGDRRLCQRVCLRCARRDGRDGARAAAPQDRHGCPVPDRRQAHPDRHDLHPEGHRHRRGARSPHHVLARHPR